MKVKPGALFNRLSVIEDTGKRKRGAKVWLCKCSCGNSVEVRTDYLQQEWTQSCGCLRSDRAKARLPEVWKNNPRKSSDKSVYKFNTLLRQYKNNAKRRDIEFALTDAEVFSLVTQPCDYCGYLPLQYCAEKYGQTYSDFYNGIDRTDSAVGYLPWNVVSCCKTCNIAKNAMSYSEFIEYLNRVYAYMHSKGGHKCLC
jgi:hypothetical protein